MNEVLKALGMTEEKAISILERLIAEDDDIDFYSLDEKMSFEMAIKALSENKGEWILKQRGNFVDIACSNCGYVRIKGYAYNRTVEELEKELNEDITKPNFCECCGADMRGGKE